MREMVNSEIDWLGDMPSHWKVHRNKALFKNVSIKNHGDATVLSLYRELGVIPKDSRDDNHNVTSLDTDSYKYVEQGDLVINKMKAWSGSLGVSDYEGIVSPAYYVCKVDYSKVTPRFIHHYMRNLGIVEAYEMYSAGMRIGQWDLSIDDFMGIKVALPPYQEQDRIAERIDKDTAKVDALIANQQAQIEKLKQYKQSLITEVVTKGLDPNASMKDSGVEWIGMMPEHWQLIRFRFIADITTGNSDTQDANPDGAYPFYVRSPIVERSNDYTFEGPGILMAGDGAGAGRVFHLVDGKYAVHQRVYRFYNFRYVDKELLKYYLENLFSTVMDYGSAKTTVPSVRLPMIQNFQVCVPPLAEQEKMVEIIRKHASSIDKLIDIKEKKIEKLTDYKKSLIYEYVTGKKEVS
jgi:type I restriction enzyme S subunit